MIIGLFIHLLVIYITLNCYRITCRLIIPNYIKSFPENVNTGYSIPVLLQKNMKKGVLILLVSFTAIAASAQDCFFARVYTSDVIAKGRIDLEFWHNSRIGHAGQYYHAQDQRMELEFGLGKNLQTSVYFNRYQERYSESANGTSVSNEIGFSNEWKWKLSDPSANRLGFALYGEWGVKGGDELELETKLIFDKNIGKSLLAFNVATEYETEFSWANNKTATSWAAPTKLIFGYQYLAKPSLGIGFEVLNHNDITKDNGWENSILSAGPTVAFRKNKWFAILNYLPQITNLRKTSTAPFSKVLDTHERMQAGFIVGISL